MQPSAPLITGLHTEHPSDESRLLQLHEGIEACYGSDQESLASRLREKAQTLFISLSKAECTVILLGADL